MYDTIVCYTEYINCFVITQNTKTAVSKTIDKDFILLNYKSLTFIASKNDMTHTVVFTLFKKMEQENDETGAIIFLFKIKFP